MTNPTAHADGGAMPASLLSRRAALGRLAGAAALALPAVAAAAASPEPDAEIIALGDEIVRRAAEANAFAETEIESHAEEFESIMYGEHGIPDDASLKAAWANSDKIGRTAAIERHADFELATDGLFNRMMAIPATTQPGRAAKVRALLVHVMCDGWLGPANELDWDKQMARELLAEFAGMTEEEIAAI